MTGATTASRVLVVGTYLPIPLPAAEASVAEVKRAWNQGFETTVVSPRLSAGDLMVPVCGLLGATRLERVRRLTSSDRLVLVVEDGFPFLPGSPLTHLVTALALRRSLRRFQHVTLVLVGGPGVSSAAICILRSAAHDIRAFATESTPPAPLGITALGPAETNPSERPLQLTVAISRRVLGRHFEPTRAVLARTVHRVRRGRHEMHRLLHPAS